MPSGGRGLSPDLDLENDYLLALLARRSRAPTGVIVFPAVSKGLSPLAAGGILPLAFNVYATVACRRRLQKALVESMNAFLEPPFATGARP